LTQRIGILGGGISGVALAAQLGSDVDVLEKATTLGGLCRTVIESGYTFDAAGPHIMFSKNKAVLELMVSVLGDNVHQRRRENRISVGLVVKPVTIPLLRAAIIAATSAQSA